MKGETMDFDKILTLLHVIEAADKHGLLFKHISTAARKELEKINEPEAPIAEPELPLNGEGK
jgi:hypothetical protein